MSQIVTGIYRKMYINGLWKDGSANENYKNLNPFNEEVIATLSLGNKVDVDEAYQVALEAQKKWARVPAKEKKQIILKAAELLEERTEEVVDILIRESGSSYTKAQIEVAGACGAIRLSADFPELMDKKRSVPSIIPDKENLVMNKPVGVIGVISPFNFPLHLSMRSVAPAIAAGNTVVLKPALQTAISGGLVIAKMFEEAGLPAGVLNVVIGKGKEIGDYFVGHPVPRIISFTGSTEVGKHIGSLASRNLKRVSLELGGNSPIIILEDADIEQAVSAALFGKFLHQGQICMIINRILVHRSIYDSFVERFVERAKKLVYGDPSKDKSVVIGPIIDCHQADKIMKIIEEGKKDARLVLEGKRIGNIITPHVFIDVKNNSYLAQTEIFGPVASIIPFDNEMEAISLANETEYGLSSSIFTNDREKAFNLALQIESGATHINDQTINDDPHAPFGGDKASGLGRFNGEWVFEEFTTLKWISIQNKPREFPF